MASKWACFCHEYTITTDTTGVTGSFLACTTPECASLVQFISREISQAVSSLFFSTRTSKDPTRELRKSTQDLILKIFEDRVSSRVSQLASDCQLTFERYCILKWCQWNYYDTCIIVGFIQDFEHLKEFGLSYDHLHKHLFYTEIYQDPAVYGNLRGLVTQLRFVTKIFSNLVRALCLVREILKFCMVWPKYM